MFFNPRPLGRRQADEVDRGRCHLVRGNLLEKWPAVTFVEVERRWTTNWIGNNKLQIPIEINISFFIFRIVSLLATSAWTSSWTWSCCTPSSWESTTGWPPSWGGWTPGGATRPSTRSARSIFVARSNFVFTGSEEDQRGWVSAYCLQGVASHHHW